LSDVLEKFAKLDTSDFPDFHSYRTVLEKGLWILWVTKERLGIRKLDAEKIASIVRDVEESSIYPKSIISAFNRAGDKVHAYRENDTIYFEIMKTGRDYLLSREKEDAVELFYFEPDKRFTSKRILSKNILNTFEGELKIVDPYCSERTLDIMKDVADRKIRFLTRVENLRGREREQFLRDLEDFKSEYKTVEFRSYPYRDIHDRYVVSPDFLAILGHSIKDLGSKESFAVLLDERTSKNIVEALNENFDRRWKKSRPI